MLGSQLRQLILPGEFLLAPPLFWNPFPATWNGNLSTSHLRGGAVPDHPPQENLQAPDITSFWVFMQKPMAQPIGVRAVVLVGDGAWGRRVAKEKGLKS